MNSNPKYLKLYSSYQLLKACYCVNDDVLLETDHCTLHPPTYPQKLVIITRLIYSFAYTYDVHVTIYPPLLSYCAILYNTSKHVYINDTFSEGWRTPTADFWWQLCGIIWRAWRRPCRQVPALTGFLRCVRVPINEARYMKYYVIYMRNWIVVLLLLFPGCIFSKNIVRVASKMYCLLSDVPCGVTVDDVSTSAICGH